MSRKQVRDINSSIICSNYGKNRHIYILGLYRMGILLKQIMDFEQHIDDKWSYQAFILNTIYECNAMYVILILYKQCNIL